MLFVTTWMNVEGNEWLSEIGQIPIWFHLYLKSKKQGKWITIAKKKITKEGVLEQTGGC